MALDSIQKASRDQFERHSANYGKSHILANTADVASALEHIDVLPGSRALDIATGGGHTAIYLATRGFTVTASDISQAMLDNAKSLAAERGLSIETRLHEAEKFPYSAASYDLVACRVAAHHFSNRESFLSEVTRVLKPGGHFLLIDGSIPDGEPIAEEWRNCATQVTVGSCRQTPGRSFAAAINCTSCVAKQRPSNSPT